MQRHRIVPAALLALLVATAPALRADDPVAAAPAGLSDVDRAALVDMLERGQKETEELIAQATGDRFTQKPAADRWSVAEVLEHIGATEKLLLGMAQAALGTPADPEAAAILTAMPVASFGARVEDRSQKAQAPDMLVPKGGQTREQLESAYREARQATLEFVRTTQAPVAAHTTATPAGKFTVHHLLALIAAHNLRHNKQIAEVIEQTATPAAAATTGSE
jgi:uncharacterized damage-inducible protein DinB